MLTLIHGDNVVKSRQEWQAAFDSARQKGQEITLLSGTEITLSSLTNALRSQSLFGGEQLVAIERLSKITSVPQRKELEKQLLAATDVDRLVWEDKTLTPAQLKTWITAKAIVKLHKSSPTVFKLMDTIGQRSAERQLLQLAHESYQADSAEFVFAMLTRQLRLLIQAKENRLEKMAPFVATKARRQCQTFTIEQLLKLHERLLTIDLNEKTSGSLLSLEQQLDLVFLALYS